MFSFQILMYLVVINSIRADDSKIVGGEFAIRYNFQWAATLFIRVTHKNEGEYYHHEERHHMFTGGVITKEAILSTCTPLKTDDRRPFTVIAGDVDTKNDGLRLSFAQHRITADTVPHPNCTKINGIGPFLNDYSIIKVDRPFELNWLLKPMTFPEDIYNSYDRMERMARQEISCTVVGWGETSPFKRHHSESGQVKDHPWFLRRLTLKIMHNFHCQLALCKISSDYCDKRKLDKLYLKHQQKFCARPEGFFPMPRGVCNGDLGAPLSCDNIVFGFVSTRMDCGTHHRLGSPIIFSSVRGGYQWFKKIFPSLPDMVVRDPDEFDNITFPSTTHAAWFPDDFPDSSVILSPVLSSVIVPYIVICLSD